MRSPRSWIAVGALVALSLIASGCDSDSRVQPPAPGSSSSVPRTELSLGVFGNTAELAAYRKVVTAYNAQSVTAHVTLETWPDQHDLIAAVRAGGAQAPDVFLTGREELGGLIAHHRIQPVDALADQRGVDLGDDYSRDAVEAFSSAHRLQCMPYGISPTVIFYNTRLVDFDRMRAKGLDAPADDTNTSWDLGQFTAAAHFASRAQEGVKGLYVPPTLAGLAPFLYSGGGDLYDDDTAPTSLAFASGGSQSALAEIIPLLRNPKLTLTDAEVAQQSPLKRFESGKLGMITGSRALVPKLRKVEGLSFDVMPMPDLGSEATIGQTTGLCLSSHTADTSSAADLLFHLVGNAPVRRVVGAGYLVPTNQQVALTQPFLQDTEMPAHASVFPDATRSMRQPPLVVGGAGALQSAVGATLAQLVHASSATQIAALSASIDQESIPVLAALTGATASADPSPDPSSSPTG